MIKAICFDFDGTLAKYQGDFGVFLESFRTDLSLMHCDMNTFAETLSAHLLRSGHVTLKSAVLKTLEQLEQHIPADLDALIARAQQDYRKEVSLLPGALELLDFCKARYPLAIITNGPEDMQKLAIEQLGIQTCFATITISGAADVAVRKPDAHIFDLTCQRLGVKPEHSLMIGDNLEADIEGARAFGMQGLLLGQNSRADVEQVRDLTGVLEFLQVRSG